MGKKKEKKCATPQQPAEKKTQAQPTQPGQTQTPGQTKEQPKP